MAGSSGYEANLLKWSRMSDLLQYAVLYFEHINNYVRWTTFIQMGRSTMYFPCRSAVHWMLYTIPVIQYQSEARWSYKNIFASRLEGVFKSLFISFSFYLQKQLLSMYFLVCPSVHILRVVRPNSAGQLRQLRQCCEIGPAHNLSYMSNLLVCWLFCIGSA